MYECFSSIAGGANQWLEVLWMSCVWLLVVNVTTVVDIIIMAHNMNKMFKA